MGLVELLVFVLIIVIVYVILTKAVIPHVPDPWGTIIIVILALIVVVYLLNRIGILSL